jgi:hypothetical protein
MEPDDPLSLLSYWLDSRFQIPGLGWRVGLDPLIGLIPGVGDLASLLLSLIIVLAAIRAGAPRITVARMGINLALDVTIGSLPVVGDLFDAWFKANERNVALLQRTRALGVRSGGAPASDWLFVAGVCLVLLALMAGAVVLTWSLIAALQRWLFG